MSLHLGRLRRVQRPVQQLITVGAFVSMVVAALLAALVMGWAWQRALLFGTLLIVTGPTVVTPLVRRLGVKRNVALVLEAEGVSRPPAAFERAPRWGSSFKGANETRSRERSPPPDGSRRASSS